MPQMVFHANAHFTRSTHTQPAPSSACFTLAAGGMLVFHHSTRSVRSGAQEQQALSLNIQHVASGGQAHSSVAICSNSEHSATRECQPGSLPSTCLLKPHRPFFSLRCSAACLNPDCLHLIAASTLAAAAVANNRTPALC